jgi:hypothetical protein
MGTFVDPAFIDYQLPITNWGKQTSDSGFPIATDYRFCNKQTEVCRLPLVLLLPNSVSH